MILPHKLHLAPSDLIPMLGSTGLDAPNTQAADITPSADTEDIRKAALDFETAFIGQMLKFSGLADALVKGGGEDAAPFTDFYIQSFAEKISQSGGFGLADKFYEKLKLDAGITDTPVSDKSIKELL